MKSILAVLLTLTSINAIADYVDGLDPRACKVVSKKHETVTCNAKNASVVNAAKPAAKNMTDEDFERLRRMGFRPMSTDARELGLITDPSTQLIYTYARLLRDETGAEIGVLHIAGYQNQQTAAKLQVALRLNLQGRLTRVAVK